MSIGGIQEAQLDEILDAARQIDPNPANLGQSLTRLQGRYPTDLIMFANYKRLDEAKRHAAAQQGQPPPSIATQMGLQDAINPQQPMAQSPMGQQSSLAPPIETATPQATAPPTPTQAMVQQPQMAQQPKMQQGFASGGLASLQFDADYADGGIIGYAEGKGVSSGQLDTEIRILMEQNPRMSRQEAFLEASKILRAQERYKEEGFLGRAGRMTGVSDGAAGSDVMDSDALSVPDTPNLNPEVDPNAGESLIQKGMRWYDESEIPEEAGKMWEYATENTIGGIEQQPKSFSNLDGKMADDLSYILEGKIKDKQGGVHDFSDPNDNTNFPGLGGWFVDDYSKGMATAMDSGLGDTIKGMDSIPKAYGHARTSGDYLANAWLGDGEPSEVTPEQIMGVDLESITHPANKVAQTPPGPGKTSPTTPTQEGIGSLTAPGSTDIIQNTIDSFDKYGIDRDAQKAANKEDRREYMLGRGLTGVGARMLASQRPGTGSIFRDLAGGFGEGVTGELPAFDKHVSGQKKSDELAAARRDKAIGLGVGAQEAEKNRVNQIKVAIAQKDSPENKAFESEMKKNGGDAMAAFEKIYDAKTKITAARYNFTGQKVGNALHDKAVTAVDKYLGGRGGMMQAKAQYEKNKAHYDAEGGGGAAQAAADYRDYLIKKYKTSAGDSPSGGYTSAMDRRREELLAQQG